MNSSLREDERQRGREAGCTGPGMRSGSTDAKDHDGHGAVHRASKALGDSSAGAQDSLGMVSAPLCDYFWHWLNSPVYRDGMLKLRAYRKTTWIWAGRLEAIHQ